MTDKEKKAYIDKHLTEIYDQLVINSEKVCGAGYERWGEDLLYCIRVLFRKTFRCTI